MKLWSNQALFAHNVARLIEYIFKSGYYCTLGEAWRTAEQAAIYAANGKGIKDSLHCKRLAIDLNLFDAEGNYLTEGKYYKRFGDYWITLHIDNRHGGRFNRKDHGHFEMNVK